MSLDVVRTCQDLIRIDTSNYGDEPGPGEREAAEYVAGILSDLGLEPTIRESEPGRASLTARWEGTDPSRDGMVLHGHLDVVPAFAEDWSVDPFGAEIRDGLLYGRGAVDMKNMDAMILASVAQMIEAGVRPERDIVIAFFADEEHGGRRGAGWMVENHPDDFAGCTEAVSEVGGFSAYVNGKRAYLLQTAEKGIQWLRLIAHGKQGHGSLVHTDNAVAHLAGALQRIAAHGWEIDVTPTVETLLRGVADLEGVEYEPTADGIGRLIQGLGAVGPMIDASIRNTANPTMMQAGYKTNVVPDTAIGYVDSRFLPGQQEQVLRQIEELAGTHVKVEPYITERSLEAPFDVPLVDKMVAALGAEDPGATVLPYNMMGGTDNKHLAQLGIAGYGFAPLLLPQDLDFPSLFHGIDERIPVDSLHFGTAVLRRFLASC
ncbi:M20/M25/M40 family metallo-hydrolase [Demequina sp. NBRC 110057]|uniref:M20/M25/M40 family metallo-hydrolase n=1 Tax=Demequina sp. NBRC 110057 TaxID=1570346 RepID=UPI000A05AB12|nr:M20/M25/M40 family metallo-hydrolase [Demequina sp. NBRC 110057]